MVVRPRMAITVATAFAFIGGGALVADSLWGLLALLPIVWVLRMRLTADSDGVIVVNFVRTFRIPWAEISGFEIGRVLLSHSLDVCKNDGTRLHVWVATMSGGRGDYSWSQVQEFATNLRHRRAKALGELPPQAEPDELEQALYAAQQGDPDPIDDLLATHRIEPEIYSERLHSLAAAGKLDLDALRVNRRARFREGKSGVT